MYGVILIAVLAVMGGLIAYIGDKLGTKVGKKKLSIFGLRPKHTSILVTIITGVLIAASTLGILSLVSRDVRTALFGMEALKANLTSLTQEVQEKNKELEASRAELEAKTAEYSGLSQKVAETAQRLAAISQELSNVMAERDRTAAALAQVQTDYAQAQGDLTTAQRQISGLQATKKDLDAKVAALTDSKAALQSDVDRLNAVTTSLKQNMQIVREGTVIYRAGEVLATAVVPAGQSLEDSKRSLASIIYRTNRELVDHLSITDKSTEVLWIANADFEQAASTLAGANGSMIIRLLVTANTVYGEPVIGAIELVPNYLVYASGATVYQAVVDAGSTPDSAEQAVLQFLQRVNAAGVKDGVLADPLQGTIGSMGGAQLFDTVNKVKRLGGKVELTAVAKTDVHTVGPLQIDITVKRVYY